jgi:hypothetical protein
MWVLITVIGLSVEKTARQVADMHEQLHDILAYTHTTHDIINPNASFSDEEPDTSDDAIDAPDSQVQNSELNDRVARLKDEIAHAKNVVASFQSPTNTPLHPDVYNLPYDTIPQSTITEEYVK